MGGHTKQKLWTRTIPVTVLIGLLVLGTSLWIGLKRGIDLSHISIAGLQAERASIRLDNGFIIRIARLDIQTASDGTSSLFHPKDTLSLLEALPRLIQELRINQILFKGKDYRLLFKDQRFSLSSGAFSLTAIPSIQENSIGLAVQELAITPYSITLTGDAILEGRYKNLHFKGRFRTPEATGRINISLSEDHIQAVMDTDPFTDLSGMLARLHADAKLTSWISESIRAESFRIEKLVIDTALLDGKPDLGPGSISGQAIASNAAIVFHPSLSPVKSREVHISYENDQLSFDLNKPHYKTKNLDGSRVTIDNLLSGQTKLNIRIQTQSQLDDDILELLQAYDIRLPLRQESGQTKAALDLVFDLPDFTLATRGSFTTGKGDWTCGGLKFQVDKTAVSLENGMVTIDKATVRYRDILMASVSGSVDTGKGRAVLLAEIERLHLRDGEKDIFLASGLTTPIGVRFGDDEIRIDLEQLQAEISLSQSSRLLILHDLNRIQPYVPSLENLPFTDGKLEVDFSTLDNIPFCGALDTDVIPLSSASGQVTAFSFCGAKSGDTLTASINDGKISLTATDKLYIKLNDYQLTVDTEKIGTKASPSAPVPIVISGPRSRIQLKTFSLPTKKFQAELTGGNVTFNARLDQGRFLFESKNGEMTLAATDIDAMIAQDFFTFADLEGGRFNLSLKGTGEKDYEGFVEFNNVQIKDLALLNNILSFINAIPALATLSSPGFDSTGYYVNQGVAHFTMTGNLLTVNQLRTDGTTINTAAGGWVDLENDILKMDVKLISLKDYSKIISKIPWAGYAILGENGTLSTSLRMTGPVSDPEITTNLPSEIVLMPINVLKRTVQWPFRLFSQIKDLANGAQPANE